MAAGADHRGLLGEPPSQVRVSVLRKPGGLTLARAIAAARALARPALLLRVSLVALVAVGSLALAMSNRHPGPAWRTGRSVASAFPMRCVSLTIALHDARFLRTDFERTLACGRHRRSGPARSYAAVVQ